MNNHFGTLSDTVNIKNLDSILTLITNLNATLTRMQGKLNDIKSETVKCKFKLDASTKMVTYEQLSKNDCQLYVDPRILWLLGLSTTSEWITAEKLEGMYKPSLDKFLQTMWIYTNIIEPQIVGDTRAHLLHVIPVKTEGSEGGLIAPVFDTPIFCKLALNYIHTFDILITNSLGDVPIEFDDNEVIIGLTFHPCI